MALALITGGSGFIGSHLVDQWVQKGHTARVLDLVEPEVARPSVEFAEGSITDYPCVREAMEGVDVVFHVAAKAGLWARRSQEFLEINDRGAENVFSAARDANVSKIVHTSTESILKCAKQSGGVAETDESVEPKLEDMVGPYCVGKFLAERRALDAARSGAPIVVVNPTIPVGPGDRNKTPPTRMLLGFLNQENGMFLDTTMNYVDVRDVAAGHIAAMERGRPGERYILGGANFDMAAVLEILGRVSGAPMPSKRAPYWLAYGFAALNEQWSNRVTGRPPRAPLTGVRLARSPMRFSNAKARRELGVAFRNLDESLADAVQWFRERGWFNENSKNQRA